MGTLLCDNGKHYHGWSLNPEYEADPEGEYKYMTTARDVDDQDEDPGELGVCQHCGKTKGQHQEVKGALTHLNLAKNNLGEIVLAAGWRSKDNDGRNPWVGPDGQEQHEKPGKPEGIIAIADAIPNMGALTSLNLSSNYLRAEGAKIVAEAMEVTNCAIAVILVHLHSHAVVNCHRILET
jgi:hypothetical protein